MRTKAKLRELMRAPDLDVKSSFEVGEVVYLPRGTTWQRQRKTTCECCDDKGYRTIEKSDHSTSCNRTLNWIVRVTYTTLYGNVAHMDSGACAWQTLRGFAFNTARMWRPFAESIRCACGRSLV